MTDYEPTGHTSALQNRMNYFFVLCKHLFFFFQKNHKRKISMKAAFFSYITEHVFLNLRKFKNFLRIRSIWFFTTKTTNNQLPWKTLKFTKIQPIIWKTLLIQKHFKLLKIKPQRFKSEKQTTTTKKHSKCTLEAQKNKLKKITIFRQLDNISHDSHVMYFRSCDHN